ncbi:MAG: SGNH/GDSL hydrolase family protein [Actinobacteria bacterium]|nr:SGNH/GDSL hydrolase family protein [Actinomycetota bacterium]
MSRGAKIVGAVVAVAVVAGAVWWWMKPAEVADGVMFVGDSVTFLSLDDLNGDLGAKHPAYYARPGFTSADLLPIFKQAVEEREADGDPLEQVAMLIGYNDVLHDDVESPALGEIMTLAGKFDCAIWLELPPVPLRTELVDRWNERARAEARKHPSIHLVDEWRKLVASDPDAYVPDDGVHPNAKGREELSRIYLDAIRNLC